MKKLLTILFVVLFANQASAEEFSVPVNGQNLGFSNDLFCQDFDDKIYTHYNKVTKDFATEMNKGLSNFISFFWLCNAQDRYLPNNPNLQLSSTMTLEIIDGQAQGVTQKDVNQLIAGSLDKIDISELGMGNDPQQTKEYFGERGFSIGTRKAIETSTYATFITNMSSETLSFFIIQTYKYLDPYIFTISIAVVQTSEDPQELANSINSAVTTSEEIANSIYWK